MKLDTVWDNFTTRGLQSFSASRIFLILETQCEVELPCVSLPKHTLLWKTQGCLRIRANCSSASLVSHWKLPVEGKDNKQAMDKSNLWWVSNWANLPSNSSLIHIEWQNLQTLSSANVLATPHPPLLHASTVSLPPRWCLKAPPRQHPPVKELIQQTRKLDRRGLSEIYPSVAANLQDPRRRQQTSLQSLN